MKRLRRLRDIAFVACGIAALFLLPMPCRSGACQLFGSKYTPEGRDGNGVLLLVFLGAALIAYGLFDLLYGRPSKRDGSSEKDST